METTCQSTRCVYILRPSEDPEHVLRGLSAVDVSSTGTRLRQRVLESYYRAIATDADLAEALSLHHTPDDVPACTEWSLRDLRALLSTGEPLYQYVLTVPDHEAEKQGSPSIIRDAVGAEALLLGPWTLSALLKVGRRMAFHAFDHGLLDVIESRWCGSVYRYALVNDRMADWVARFERWVPADEIQCAWFTQEQLERALGMLGSRDVNGRLHVYTGFPFVEWAARQRSREQLSKIIQAQVTE